MNITFRAATIRDLKDIQNLGTKLTNEEYRRFDKTILKHTKIRDKKDRKDIRRNIKNGCVVLALAGKLPVAYILGSLEKSSPYRIPLRIANLELMYVSKNYRRFGIGTKLIKKFLIWAKSKKADRIKVVAYASNNEAINLYRKFGFNDYTIRLEKNLTK